ncbi:MAG: tRNA (adenosine(37)-N6)-threonylcarbamoyltransferase complex dimerization subunit type 1 TsaB [Verrucomicrobiales bacterium]
MIILALDTSTPRGEVALVRFNADQVPETLVEYTFESERSHNSLVFDPLARILRDGPAPNHIVVGTGPGSYTGIRIGIAAAHGLATGLGLPWSGHDSLSTLSDESAYHVVGDARRDGFYLATIRDGQLVVPAEIFPMAELTERLSGLTDPIFTTDARPLDSRLHRRPPSAVRLARSAACAAPASGAIEPIYLRAPHITQPTRALPPQ